MNDLSSNYTERITKNSSWAMVNFILTGTIYFIVSVLLARYLGREQYGVYAYFMWFISIGAILGGFGLNQTMTKYLPDYFFSKDAPFGRGTVLASPRLGLEEKKPQANKLFQILLIAQIISGVLTMLIFLMLTGFLSLITNFSGVPAEKMFLIAALTIVPLTINNLCASAISALQQFKKLTLIQTGLAAISFTVITFFMLVHGNIIILFWLILGINLSFTIPFLLTLKKLLQKSRSSSVSAKLPIKKLLRYSLLSYIMILFSQIAWDKSEIFFLGKFSNASQIALYSLAYSMALLMAGFFAAVNNVLNYTTAEIVTHHKDETLKYISEHVCKYLALLMFPAVIYITLFMKDIVILFYGEKFALSALLFPLLAIGHLVGIMISPANNVPMYKNEIHKIMLITVAAGILNILLDLLIVPSHQAFGAAIANTFAQFFYIGLILLNARKYRLGILNRYMLRIIGINLILAILASAFIFYSDLMYMKALFVLLTVFIYSAAVMRFAFNLNDLELLRKLHHLVPKLFQSAFLFIFNRIEKNVHKTK